MLRLDFGRSLSITGSDWRTGPCHGPGCGPKVQTDPIEPSTRTTFLVSSKHQNDQKHQEVLFLRPDFIIWPTKTSNIFTMSSIVLLCNVFYCPGRLANPSWRLQTEMGLIRAVWSQYHRRETTSSSSRKPTRAWTALSARDVIVSSSWSASTGIVTVICNEMHLRTAQIHFSTSADGRPLCKTEDGWTYDSERCYLHVPDRYVFYIAQQFCL